MEILNRTIIAPAAPHIGADLGVPAVDVNVAISAYVLTLAVLVPLSGWLSDRSGARRLFLAAITVFTLPPLAAARRRPCRCSRRCGCCKEPVGRLWSRWAD